MSIKIFQKVKVPVILQNQAAESGAVSLAMVFAYYGLILPPEKMREDCGITSNGTTLPRLLAASIKSGFDAEIQKKSKEELRTIKLPAVISWNTYGFVVLSGYQSGKYIINDPDSGVRTINEADFDSSYSGDILILKPGKNFKKSGKKKTILYSINERLSGNKKELYFVLISGLLLILPGIVVPGFYRTFIDDILILNQEDWYKPLILALIVVIFYGGIITYVQQRALLKLELRMAIKESAKFFMHVFKLPLSFFQERHSGEIIKRVQLNDTLAQYLSGDLAKNALNLMSVIFFAAVMFYYDVLLTVIGVSFAIINLVALRITSTKKTTLNQKQVQNRGKTFSVGGSGLEMIETIKSTGSENDFYALWSGYQASMLNKDQELGVTNRMLTELPEFLSNLNNIIIICLGGLLIIKGEVTIGLLIAFQNLMSNFSQPIKELVEMGGKIQESISFVKTIDDAMSNPVDDIFQNEELASKHTITLNEAKLSGKLELKNITFGYDRYAPPLISDFSITVQPGRRVALIGGSGSGKSTVAKIVMGLLKPWEGKVLIDGRERTDYPFDVLTNSLAMVDQEIFLFFGTVNDNISMWNKSIGSASIIEAAKDACIHDIIAARPNGYESTIAPGGSNYSGGQQQRIEIARALAKNPTVIVMDEATSALDPNTEQIIDSNIRRRGCTALIVAHRLSTIRDCDEIIVLDKGTVVQRGSHDELMTQTDKLYYSLIKQS